MSLATQVAALATRIATEFNTVKTNLAAKAPLANPAFTGTVGGVTAAMVGLGNVNNTSDVGKPVSTAQAAADALKVPLPYVVRLCSTGYLASLAGALTIDSVATVAGDRVLLRHQGDPVGGNARDNGIYVVAAGAWTRASDFDTAAEIGRARVFVTEGTNFKNKTFVTTFSATDTVGTTAMPWVGEGSRVDFESLFERPVSTGVGHMLYDGSRKILFVDNNGSSNWQATQGIAEITPSGAAPSFPVAGQSWYDPATTSNKIWDGTRWIYQGNLTARVVATTNVASLSGSPVTIDGVSCAVGDAVLLAAQTTASQNGLYLVASGAWTRIAGADTTYGLNVIQRISIREGTIYVNTVWSLSFTTIGTVGTTAVTVLCVESPWISFVPVVQNATTFAVIASTGATGIYRVQNDTCEVEATASNTPATTGGASLTVPVTPATRSLHAGSMVCMGATPPADQCGIAIFRADRLAIQLTAYSNGFRDSPAGYGLRYNIRYKIS